VLQKIAVSLREKTQYKRAEQLLIKAINLKKPLNKGSEVHLDIAYLYSELALTYQKAGSL
jgi:hypothetical protein